MLSKMSCENHGRRPDVLFTILRIHLPYFLSKEIFSCGFTQQSIESTVVPVAELSTYCEYVATEDCYHIPDFKHVCGTNGKSYRNHCQLARDHCLDNSITKAHDGMCQGTVAPSPSPTSASVTPDPIQVSETALDIFCMDVSYITCPTGGTAVCATDGKTYANKCEFDKALCTHRNIRPNATCTTSP